MFTCWDTRCHVGPCKHVCLACPPVTRGHSSSSANPHNERRDGAGAQAQQNFLEEGLECLGAWHSDPCPCTGPSWGPLLCTGRPSLPTGTLLLQPAVWVSPPSRAAPRKRAAVGLLLKALPRKGLAPFLKRGREKHRLISPKSHSHAGVICVTYKKCLKPRGSQNRTCDINPTAIY